VFVLKTAKTKVRNSSVSQVRSSNMRFHLSGTTCMFFFVAVQLFTCSYAGFGKFGDSEFRCVETVLLA